MNYKPTQLLFIDASVDDIETFNQSTLSTSRFNATNVKNPTTLVVIDQTVEDYATLIVGLQPGITAAVIDPQAEGLTQITQLLSQGHYQRLVIVAHGEPGKIHLGKTLIASQTIQTHRALLCEWAVDEIVLCSCRVGADEVFIQQLADQTGSRIIASPINLGMGNWMTEASTIFQADTLANYHHTLELTWDAALTLPNNSPNITGQYGLEINGNFLYVTDFDGGNIDIYNLNSTTGGITYNSSFGSSGSGVDQFSLPIDLAFFTTSGEQTKAYVPDYGNGRIVVMTVNPATGQLTWDAALTLPNNSPNISGSIGLEINGNFLYVTDNRGDNIDIYNLNSTTGAITYNSSFGSSGSGVNEFFRPLDLAFFTTSGGQTKAYVPDYSNKRIVVMTVNPATGQLTWDAALTLPNNSPNISGQSGLEINGNFLYVTDSDGGNIDIYNLNSTTGGITYNSSFGSLGSGVNEFFKPLDLVFFTTSGGQTKAYVPDNGNKRIVVLNSSPANTAPTLATPTAISYTDTIGDDTFTAQTGTLAATDPDSGQTLTYGINGGTVNGTTVTKIGTYGTLSLNSSSGAYTFTPVDGAIEALTSNATEGFTFTISDGTTTDNKTLDINLTGVNDTPTLQNAIADQIAQQDTAFSFTFDANTFNDVDAGDNLTYSATLQDGSNLPNWLKFNAATRTFSGTPTNADVVNLTIEVQAKDNDGVSATDTFALAVEPNNGTPTFKLSKIADDIFKISNSSSKSKLQVTLTGQSSNLVNEIGVFTVDDAQGNINGIAPGAAGYAQAALDRAKVIFSAIANVPNGFNTDNLTHLLEFNSDDNLRFYLVKNSTIDAVRAGISPFTDILFSDPLTQKITDLGNDDFSLAWKDGGNNAADFNNLVVKIQSTNDSLPLGTNLQGNLQGEVIDLRGVTSQVKADFVVNREAAFKNFIGFYQVADENGGIDTNSDGKADILTGQAGYTEAAVRGRVAGIDLTVNNQGSATSTGTFQPSSIFVPFIITNGTPDALLDSNPNNDPAVYFPFLGANADKVDHIRLLGNNVFGFEDLASGGDKDFNDMIVRVNLTIA
ncbi:DUF4347 domain-containing protein [Nostoc sp.]|uniref:DUF4347 domain-containing protein n=1 Tax=Nostoc sp. TaxID=1180 RepID=UPI002FFC850E